MKIKAALAVAAAAIAMVVGAGDIEEIKAKIGAEYKITSVDSFYGFPRVVFDFQGYEAWVVCPKGEVREGRPWTWVMQWATAFVPRTNVPQMLEDGYHHVTINTFKDKMTEPGLKVTADFQKFLVEKLGFAPKAYLIGMSWGGFFSIRYANRHPENVAKIYLDAPLLCFADFRHGIGAWETMMPEGGWATSPEMPVNMAENIAKAKIPILVLYGGADRVVPPEANCEVFLPRFKAAGGYAKVIRRGAYAHHPHGVEVNETTIKSFFEAKQIIPVLHHEGEIESGKNGWASYGDGCCKSLQGPTIKLDKKADENAFYRLTFEAKTSENGIWRVDMSDADERTLPEVSGQLLESAEYQKYSVVVLTRPDAVEAAISFEGHGAVGVKNIDMVRIETAEAAQFARSEYEALPVKLEMDVPGAVWAKLQMSRTAIQVAKNFNIVFIGDPTLNDTWGGLFDPIVREEFPDTEFKTYLMLGVKDFEKDVAKCRPNLVVIGGVPKSVEKNCSQEEAIEAMAETAKRCQKLGAEVVFASSVCGNEVLKAAAERAGAQFWDVTSAVEAAKAKSGKPANWFMRDGRYCNNRGKALYAWAMWLHFNAAQK